MSENTSPTKGSNKLTTMFLIVLGVHVVIIIGLCAYSLLKGDSAPNKEQEIAEKSGQEELQGASLTETLPTDQDTVFSYEVEEVAEVTPSQSTQPRPVLDDEHFTSPYASSMPATSDSAWSGIKELPKGATKVSKQETVLLEARPAPATNPMVKEAAPTITKQIDQPVVDYQKYIVRKGDTLSRISKQFGVSVNKIKQINGLSNDLIKIGQSLEVPVSRLVSQTGLSKVPVKVTLSAGSTHENDTSYITYTVKKGDTLWRISHNHGTKTSIIAQLNGLSDPAKIKVGMKLKIPVRSGSTLSKNEKSDDPEVVPFRTASMNSEMAMLREAQE
ncbi:MAG: LysM peptidoglycan-binding domain-containing protein [Verrucomicrobiota bacterium]